MTQQTRTEREDILKALTDASNRFQAGDPTGFERLYSEDEDVTLYGAKGGCAHGRQSVLKVTKGAAHALGMGGTTRYEILAARVSGDLAYVASLQRVDNLGESGQVTLRVTHVLARENGVWRLLHRHADPLQKSPFA